MLATQLPPLPPYSNTALPDLTTINYYANLCGVLSERRWEWAAANGLDGWADNRCVVIDLAEHQMKTAPDGALAQRRGRRAGTRALTERGTISYRVSTVY